MYNEIFDEIRARFPYAHEILIEIKTDQPGIDSFDQQLREYVKDQGAFIIPSDTTEQKELQERKFTQIKTPWGEIKLTKDA